ncbi:leucine-rich repeat domain-containing protein [Candidatus Babeliales bacterium]|nr:leucine-rich repeat domain-containing protein [Candidatus Babeliales bacterium]
MKRFFLLALTLSLLSPALNCMNDEMVVLDKALSDKMVPVAVVTTRIFIDGIGGVFRQGGLSYDQKKGKNLGCKLIKNTIWVPKNIEKLYLDRDAIIEILPQISNLTKLKFLDLQCNYIKMLPESIAQLQLTFLDISRNNIETPPLEIISKLKELTYLDLEDYCTPPWSKQKRVKVCLTDLFALNEMLKKCTKLTHLITPCGRRFINDHLYKDFYLDRLRNYLNLQFKVVTAFNSNKTPPELSFSLFRNMYNQTPKTYCKCQPFIQMKDGSTFEPCYPGSYTYKHDGPHKPFCHYVPNLDTSLFDLSENKPNVKNQEKDQVRHQIPEGCGDDDWDDFSE